MASGLASDLFRIKTLERLNADAESGENKLERHLGPWSLIGLGIGAVIGAGLFSLTGIAAAEHAGPAVTLSFAIAAIGCALAGMCYSELAGMIPVAGSAYTYTYATMGEFIAWIIGWDLVLEYAVGAATVSVSWSRYVTRFMRDTLGINLPGSLVHSPFETYQLADGTMAHGLVNVPAILIVVAASSLLIVGIRESARVNGAVVILKLAVVATVIGVGLFYVKAQNYDPFLPANTGTFGEYGWSGVMRAAGVVFFAYVGFETVSTAAGETRNPQRDAPVGLIGSLLVTAALYGAVAAVLTGLVPYRELDVADPIAKAMDATGLSGFSTVIKLGALIGLTTAALTALYGQARICYAMARDRMLPDAFARIGETSRTPFVAQGLIGLVTAAAAALVPIGILGELVSIGTLFAFVLVCVSVLILRRTEPGRARPFRVPGGPLVPVLGILACLTLMASLPGDTWLRLLVWLGLGLAIWFGYCRRRVGASPGFERTSPFAGPGQSPG